MQRFGVGERVDRFEGRERGEGRAVVNGRRGRRVGRRRRRRERMVEVGMGMAALRLPLMTVQSIDLLVLRRLPIGGAETLRKSSGQVFAVFRRSMSMLSWRERFLQRQWGSLVSLCCCGGLLALVVGWSESE